jgi:hypothetical protein
MKSGIDPEFRGMLADFCGGVNVEESSIGVVDIDDITFMIRDDHSHLHVVQEFPEEASLLGQGLDPVYCFVFYSHDTPPSR